MESEQDKANKVANEIAAAADAAAKEEREKSEGIRVFVYGTLKTGKSNYGLLSSSTYLGRAVITGKYKMVDLGWYPGLIHDTSLKENVRVYGEVFRVSEETLHMLDHLEGHPNYYCRTKVPTSYKNSWCYFLPVSFLNRKELIAVEPAVWKPDKEEAAYYMNSELGEGSASTDAPTAQ